MADYHENRHKQMEERMQRLEDRVDKLYTEGKQWAVDEFAKGADELGDLRVLIERGRTEMYKMQYLMVAQVLIFLLGIVVEHFWR